MYIGEIMAESFRGGNIPTPNKNNQQTANRRKLYAQIKEQGGNDPDAELDYALSIVRENLPTIQQYVMSRGEVPADSVEDLTLQAYNLRQTEAQNLAQTLDVNVNDALIFLEDDEASNIDANIGTTDNFLGMYSAPVEIAASHLLNRIPKDQVDNFVDPALVAGLLNTAGEKINSSKLRRAAENKPAGVVGLLSAGGTKAYNALRTYLQDAKNKDEKAAVLNGTITDVSQLRLNNTDQVPEVPGQGGLFGQIKLTAKQLADEVAKQKKKEYIQKYLPIAIIGLVLLIVIVYFVARKK